MPGEHIELDIKYHLDGFPDDSDRYRQAAAWVYQRFQLKKLSASIAVVDNETIHRVNREHLQHDWPTDVISFIFENGDRCIEGEIIASGTMAHKLHSHVGWDVGDELLLYVVHGFLHLAGLDDADERQQQEMREHEQACLMSLGVPKAQEHIARWKDIAY